MKRAATPEQARVLAHLLLAKADECSTQPVQTHKSGEKLKSADARLSRAALRLQEANRELHEAEVEHRLASDAVDAALDRGDEHG